MFNIFKIDPFTGERKELTFKEFTFPAGEVSVKLNANDYAYKDIKLPNVIVARLQSAEDVLKLAMLKDAIERFDSNPINLFMPYIPYARQDRVCDKGEAFSLKVFGNFINALNFNKVVVVDPHSLVGEAVFDRLTVISQLNVVNSFLDFTNAAVRCLLVSPDAGSNKKTAEVASYFNHGSFIRADKLRDLTNGKIKEIVVYADDLRGRDVVILDDICERGGTFMGLATELKKRNCGKIHLYVTHGVFAGKDKDAVLAALKTGGIDEIWTTDSFRNDLEAEGVNVLNLVERFYDKL